MNYEELVSTNDNIQHRLVQKKGDRRKIREYSGFA